MHAELLPPRLVGAAVFFDPGLAAAPGGAGYYRPGDLPLDAAAVRDAVRQYESLEREVKDPRELDAFFAARFEDLFPESSHGIQDALRDRMTPGRPRAEKARAVKAQLGLCLAWRLEEKLVELSGLERGFDHAFKALVENLGISGEDEEELPPGLLGATAVPDPRTLALEYKSSWRQLLTAMLRFVPPQTGLLIADAAVVEAWTEAGLLSEDTPRPDVSAFVPSEFSGVLSAMSLPGWRLLLAGRPRPESPWLDATRVVLFPATPEE
ncbi:hypothetical protein GD604_08005 [Desulfolutivibrio sulfoxidireducens]|nr:hypothetical protein GD604_08005 [Desulfolutivibrio sulfoxidireducens]